MLRIYPRAEGSPCRRTNCVRGLLFRSTALPPYDDGSAVLQQVEVVLEHLQQALHHRVEVVGADYLLRGWRRHRGPSEVRSDWYSRHSGVRSDWYSRHSGVRSDWYSRRSGRGQIRGTASLERSRRCDRGTIPHTYRGRSNIPKIVDLGGR